MGLKRRTKPTRLEGSILVIDSPMGSGKTTYMLDYVKKHPEQQYLIIVPYLTEVDRWDKAIPHLKKPTDEEVSKKESLEALLKEGASIITTHALFDHIEKTHLNHIRTHNYSLIIDETIPVIEPQPFHQADIDVAVDAGVISIKDGNRGKRLEWNDKTREVPALKLYKERITRKEVMCGPTGYFWCLNRWKLLVFRKIFVLTYMFESSFMAAYLKMNIVDIPYEVKSLTETGKDINLTNYNDPKGVKYKHLIQILDKGAHKNRITKLKDISLTKSGYDKLKSHDFKAIKDATRSFFAKYKKPSTKKDYMFTTFKDHQDNVTHSSFYNKIENTEGEEYNECFVSLNARASNKYAHKKYLAYLIDRHPRPDILTFLSKHGSSLNKENYALSELLQWIFRSSVRNNQPIEVFIPSTRMRNLLRSWLTDED